MEHIRAMVRSIGRPAHAIESAILQLWEASTLAELLAQIRDGSSIENVRHMILTGKGTVSIAARLVIMSSLAYLSSR